MSKESRQANSAISAVTARSTDLVDQYTVELDAFVNNLVPPLLDNAEYAARTSALMIALNRELARCSAAFGEAHQVPSDAMVQLVIGQFANNFARAREAVAGEAQTVQ